MVPPALPLRQKPAVHGEQALAPAVMAVLDTVCEVLTVIVQAAVHVAPAVMVVPASTPVPVIVMPTVSGPVAKADTVRVVPEMAPVKDAA